MRLDVLQLQAFSHERYVQIATWTHELQLAIDFDCWLKFRYLGLASNELGIELRYSRFQPVHLP